MPLLEQVYDMTYRKEIAGESVPNDQKLFSIYELHTDIIVKGSREIKFGHKVNIGTGKSNLILTCEVLEGNPADSTLYQGTIDKLIESYGKVPRDSATDGGYAAKANAEYAQEKGIVNIVFNKIVGSLKVSHRPTPYFAFLPETLPLRLRATVPYRQVDLVASSFAAGVH